MLMLSHPVCLGLVLLLSSPFGGLAAAQEGEVVQQAQLEAWSDTIKKEVEELRGQAFKRPVAVSTANLSQFVGYVKERMDKDSSIEEIEAQELVAKMLAVIPVEMSLLGTYMEMLESQVGGFYDPNTESFCLMERFGGDLARIVLAHELTHALDDQYYDIDGTLAKIEQNADQSLAYHAVVEGSGTATQNAWIKTHTDDLDLKALGSMEMKGMETSPPFLWKPLIGSYNLGASFLVRSNSMMKGQMNTPTAVDLHVAFKRPPLSTEQIMHPEKYWDADKRDDPIAVRFDLSKLPKDWKVLGEDTLGEMGLGFMIEPRDKRVGLTGAMQMFTMKYTYPASEGWGGDRYLLLGNGKQRVLLMTTVWDTPKDMLEFKEEFALHDKAIDASLNALCEAQTDAGGILKVHSRGWHSTEPLVLQLHFGINTSGETCMELRDLLAVF